MKKILFLLGMICLSQVIPARQSMGIVREKRHVDGSLANYGIRNVECHNDEPGDTSDDKPGDKPVAPYSPAVMTSGGMLFISGQIPLQPETGTVMRGDIEEETRIVMEKIGRILKKNGMDYSHLVKCTVFLTDIRDYQAVNKVYGSYFEKSYPAREAIEVANLPLGASIEISGIAAK